MTNHVTGLTITEMQSELNHMVERGYTTVTEAEKMLQVYKMGKNPLTMSEEEIEAALSK